MKKTAKKTNKALGEILNQRFRMFRDQLGLTQKQIGDILGVSQANISRLEKDPDNPSSSYILMLVSDRFRNLNMNFIFGRSNEMFLEKEKKSPALKGALSSIDIMEKMQKQIMDLQQEHKALTENLSQSIDLPDHLNPFLFPKQGNNI